MYRDYKPVTTDDKFAYVAKKLGIENKDDLYQIYWRKVVKLYYAFKACEIELPENEYRGMQEYVRKNVLKDLLREVEKLMREKGIG
ncbi:MAG: hypothetical protein LPK00_13200 [Bacillaceae bacterium]|nr:hypothetical protein [Bacillaceae bacterium]